MDRRIALVGGTSLALVAVFTTLALTVVHARRPVDRRVDQSFRAVVNARAGGAPAVAPQTCRKDRPFFYSCGIAIRRRGGQRTLYWRLWLRDDGCWTASQTWASSQFPLGRWESRLAFLRGCTFGSAPA